MNQQLTSVDGFFSWKELIPPSHHGEQCFGVPFHLRCAAYEQYSEDHYSCHCRCHCHCDRGECIRWLHKVGERWTSWRAWEYWRVCILLLCKFGGCSIEQWLEDYRWCGFLEHIKIPPTIAMLPYDLFGGCSQLLSIKLNEGGLTVDSYRERRISGLPITQDHMLTIYCQT